MVLVPLRVSRVLVWLVGPLLVVVVLASCDVFSAERQYLSTMFNHAQRTLATLSRLQELASDAKLGDSVWEGEVDTHVRTLRGLVDESRQIVPPAQFDGIHRSYMDVMDRLQEMVDLYDQAMEIRNNQQLQQARRMLEESQGKINDLVQQLEALQARLEQQQ
jgi:hypothetical protein